MFARPYQDVVGELRVRTNQRHRPWRRIKRFCDRKERIGQDALWIRSKRGALKVPRIFEFGVRSERQQHHHHLLALHDHRHRRYDQIRRGAHDEVDFVDINELCVDAGNSGGVGLVVVIDELNRAAEKAAVAVDLFGPDLLRQQMGLSGGGKPAGQRYAKADLDRLLRMSRRDRSQQQA